MKMCNACGDTKPYDQFNKNSETPDGYRYTCKECRKNRVPTNPKYTMLTRKRQDKSTRTPYRTRGNSTGGTGWSEIKRLDKYGLTSETLSRMLEEQEGKCACCFTTLAEKYCIDHCHDTGKVRGLLCYRCNSGIGLLGDNIDGVNRALVYLSR